MALPKIIETVSEKLLVLFYCLNSSSKWKERPHTVSIDLMQMSWFCELAVPRLAIAASLSLSPVSPGVIISTVFMALCSTSIIINGRRKSWQNQTTLQRSSMYDFGDCVYIKDTS